MTAAWGGRARAADDPHYNVRLWWVGLPPAERQIVLEKVGIKMLSAASLCHKDWGSLPRSAQQFVLDYYDGLSREGGE